MQRSLESDVLIKRYLKGISRLRPSRPRYESMWDPQRLLDYIEILPEQMTLQTMSQKLVTLLAFITGGRLQTISFIRISNLIESNQEIQIVITDSIKTTGTNKIQPTLHVPFFREKPSLCVATTLKDYIKRTVSIRQSQQDLLFLTTVKLHGEANKQTS
ncbi:hypothetical protein NQ315_014219 [Exocentrus adspersus]|uniref:Tyr recombinase domain-containing protein n=1 Tax=Exocentrus adspersus TaxID=1586481 RepID=A0AAV8V9L2_9CUCU|nr:hypothetical protein NQ315_014219 [Exocentrus adspersus]